MFFFTDSFKEFHNRFCFIHHSRYSFPGIKNTAATNSNHNIYLNTAVTINCLIYHFR